MTETDFEKWNKDKIHFCDKCYKKVLKDAGFHVDSQREKDLEWFSLIDQWVQWRAYGNKDSTLASIKLFLKEWKSKRGEK